MYYKIIIGSFVFAGMTLTLLLLAPGAFSADALVKGDIQRMRVNKLTGNIHWHQSLAQAQTDARSRGKMIFWVNILGKLTDAT